MSNNNEQRYLKKILNLKRAFRKGNYAPHKPILLLALFESIDKGEIKENKIFITPLLVGRFKDYWSWLVKESLFKPNFALPFFHLRSEEFWHLQTIIGREVLLTSSFSIKSFGQLKESVDYAYLDDELFSLLLVTEIRKKFLQAILSHYFNSATIYGHSTIFDDYKRQMLNESSLEYKRLAAQADEEEVFVRNGIFKKVVPQIYNYTCCATGLKIISGYDIQMVDACHIVPFSISHDDTITNGLSFCPNLHRAFDRGLITISENYQITVSNSFVESGEGSIFKSLQGKSILLPEQKKYLPSQDNLFWHRRFVFKT